MWIENDTETWRPETFQAICEILLERGVNPEEELKKRQVSLSAKTQAFLNHMSAEFSRILSEPEQPESRTGKTRRRWANAIGVLFLCVSALLLAFWSDSKAICWTAMGILFLGVFAFMFGEKPDPFIEKMATLERAIKSYNPEEETDTQPTDSLDKQ